MTTVDLNITAVLKADADAVQALIAWRRTELRGADVGSPEWQRDTERLRDAADRVLASLRKLQGALEPLAAPALLANRRAERAERQSRSSSQAGVASFTGRHFPPRAVMEGERPCGHRDEDACEACVSAAVVAGGL